MKIGFDLRFLDDHLYAQFVKKLMTSILAQKTSHTYILYTQKQHDDFNIWSHVTQQITPIACGSLPEQTQLLRIYNQEACDMMIFFTHHIPLWYKKPYIIWVENLKNVYYQNFSNTILKHWYLYSMKNSINRAQKVICFDINTQSELTERFDTDSENIALISPFFPQDNPKVSEVDLNTNIRSKYHITNDFLIYSAGDGIEKNTEKLVLLIQKYKEKKIPLDLIFLWEDIVKNIPLRDKVIEAWLQKQIQFIWDVSKNEYAAFYQEARATIFPSLYESFAFELFEPLYYNSPLLVSNIENISEYIWKHGQYFSPISLHSIEASVNELLSKKIEIPQYKSILNRWSSKKTATEFLKIIENNE